jgi:hypothetical protein
MRAQKQARPAPAGSPEPLSAEDRAVVESLDLLEALELLESWGADEALSMPELEEAEPP